LIHFFGSHRSYIFQRERGKNTPIGPLIERDGQNGHYGELLGDVKTLPPEGTNSRVILNGSITVLENSTASYGWVSTFENNTLPLKSECNVSDILSNLETKGVDRLRTIFEPADYDLEAKFAACEAKINGLKDFIAELTRLVPGVMLTLCKLSLLPWNS
jgi:hypothetical protein